MHSYLMAPQKIELGKVDFRTKAGTSAKDRARIETELLEWVERCLQIEDLLGMDSWSSASDAPLSARVLAFRLWSHHD